MCLCDVFLWRGLDVIYCSQVEENPVLARSLALGWMRKHQVTLDKFRHRKHFWGVGKSLWNHEEKWFSLWYQKITKALDESWHHTWRHRGPRVLWVYHIKIHQSRSAPKRLNPHTPFHFKAHMKNRPLHLPCPPWKSHFVRNFHTNTQTLRLPLVPCGYVLII